ncbi:serine hydrolase domain-containing protein [Flindersiella endophytica]
MRLADRGLVDLDAPVMDVLDELALPPRAGEPAVTLRHLLSHSSGLEDSYGDTGRGDDALQRYVRDCSDLPRLASPGVIYSYGNPGFRTAVGHLDGLAVAAWPVPRSAGPAGGILCSIGDLLGFARMHLAGGVSGDGTRVLSQEAVAEMQRLHIGSPDARTGAGWGVGWQLFDRGKDRLIGHDGGAVGISAFLRILPGRQVGLALTTNGGNGGGLQHDLFNQILGALHGIQIPPEAEPTSDENAPDDVDPRPYLGTYLRRGWELEVVFGAAGLKGILRLQEPMSRELGTDILELDLRALDNVRFVQRTSGSQGPWDPVAFLDLPPHGRFVHMWGRSTPKVE